MFDSHFCNPARGNEKGQVENLVGYARRNYLVPLPKVSSLEELNTYLRAKCEENRNRPHPTEPTATVGQVWERERAALQPLSIKPFDARRQVDVKANSLSTVQFDGNRYSVPSDCAHQWLQLRASVDQVQVYRDGEQAYADAQQQVVQLQFELAGSRRELQEAVMLPAQPPQNRRRPN